MATLEYRPLNLGRWIVWGSTALVMILLPLIFTEGFTLTLMSQIGIGVIFALS
jgi:branched-chain amino acid transport system permease protein